MHRKAPLAIGNYYTEQFKDAWDVAEKTAEQLILLKKKHYNFVHSFCESDLPDVVKESALFNLSTLRTQTCFRTPDGRLFGFEGCGDKKGCCLGHALMYGIMNKQRLFCLAIWQRLDAGR